jgi:hypothetical protein
MKTSKGDRRAVILCDHVASGIVPILRAVRDEPTAPEDSGWQFLCGCKEENSDAAKVWLVDEVLEHDASIAPFINFPSGTVLTRADASDKWLTAWRQPEAD